MQDELPLIMEENGKRYRLLQVGETLEIGDEVLMKDSGKWEVVDKRTTMVVEPADSGYMTYGYYRRPIAEDAQ